ncbi:hypothetical protein [Sandaracinus amylolyticus]|uniref:Outer membrane protein beta-barrel domain-containing protein n=1 Tax=Sandaracinus amylolyticus TaxID=927083 RepID=A0A0F6SGF4_9BACT|nr:hypothetical protein [Sandaracinus amylolyticus]AKF08599.1 hypothetical protein DB32_005748 [Sandaracinus amylolyticus]
MRYTSSAFPRASGALLAILSLASSILAAGVARADDDPSVVHHVEPPPAPDDHPATLAVEVHGGANAPIERSTICPPAAGCVLGLGVGVGVQIERRTADRVGLWAGYDFWLLDSNAVFELAALHAIRGGVRYVFDDSTMVHPFVDAGIGLMAFGDTASVATAGGLITAGGGAELELSESVVFVTALETWLFATAPFETPDAVERSSDFGVNVALQITIGISVLVGPAVALR